MKSPHDAPAPTTAEREGSRATLVTAFVFALGVASWLVLAAIVRDLEAWDSPFYFVVIVPLSIVVGFGCARVCGGPSWRWPLAFFGGEFAVMATIWLTRGIASLWPFSIAFLVVFALPSWLAAVFGVRLRQRG